MKIIYDILKMFVNSLDTKFILIIFTLISSPSPVQIDPQLPTSPILYPLVLGWVFLK